MYIEVSLSMLLAGQRHYRFRVDHHRYPGALVIRAEGDSFTIEGLARQTIDVELVTASKLHALKGWVIPHAGQWAAHGLDNRKLHLDVTTDHVWVSVMYAGSGWTSLLYLEGLSLVLSPLVTGSEASPWYDRLGNMGGC